MLQAGWVGGWSSLKKMIVYLVKVLNIYSGASGRGGGWVEGGRERMVRKEGARDLEGGRGISICALRSKDNSAPHFLLNAAVSYI